MKRRKGGGGGGGWSQETAIKGDDKTKNKMKKWLVNSKFADTYFTEVSLTEEFPMVVCGKSSSLSAARDGHTSEASVGMGTVVSISVYIRKLMFNL